MQMSGVNSTRDVDQPTEPAKPHCYQAYGMMGLDVLDSDNDCEAFTSQIDLTSYWRKVKNILDGDGKRFLCESTVT